MRTKQVNRYYCDFCKKSGCSKFHLQKHESSCTANPNRVCRMCKFVADDGGECEQKPMAELLALLPKGPCQKCGGKHFELHVNSPFGADEISSCLSCNELTGRAVLAMPSLRKAAVDCPMCILAAIRQAGLASYIDNETFDFKKERERLFSDINDARATADHYG